MKKNFFLLQNFMIASFIVSPFLFPQTLQTLSSEMLENVNSIDIVDLTMPPDGSGIRTHNLPNLIKLFQDNRGRDLRTASFSFINTKGDIFDGTVDINGFSQMREALKHGEYEYYDAELIAYNSNVYGSNINIKYAFPDGGVSEIWLGYWFISQMPLDFLTDNIKLDYTLHFAS